jgi:dTDP-4-amino-4,6-dideoxygalactose transaminase
MSKSSEAPIPFLNLRAQYASQRHEIRAAMDEVLELQQFILGPQGAGLEREVAAYCDAKHAVALANGTDALTIALAACGVGPGDEVIVPAFTFVATATAVVRLGARPVFADIDPGTFNMNPNEIEARRTPRTKAVMPVHLYGQPAVMDAIGEIAARHTLVVIEDNAQAIGARYRGQRTGSFGAAAGLSFYPTKNLGAYGDGGMLVTNSDEVMEKVRRLRDHGQSGKYVSSEPGWNSRLDELQAAVLRVKLRQLDEWTDARRAHARLYDELLAGIPGLTVPAVSPHCEHVYHLYTVRMEGGAERRDRVQRELASTGISTGVYYPTPLPFQPLFAHLGHRSADFPAAQAASSQVLSLPLFPELTRGQIERVAEGLRTAMRGTA